MPTAAAPNPNEAWRNNTKRVSVAGDFTFYGLPAMMQNLPFSEQQAFSQTWGSNPGIAPVKGTLSIPQCRAINAW
jgi:hypothetical protein